MSRDTLERLARRLALAAGLLDFATGAGLVLAPASVLGLMGIASPGTEAAVYLRWIGAFVGAVGFTYLWALHRGGPARLRATLEFTVWFRLAAGGYSAWAVAAGALAPAWLGVPATDFFLAGTQIWLLARGVFRRGT